MPPKSSTRMKNMFSLPRRPIYGIPFLKVLIFSAIHQTGFSCNVSVLPLPARNFLPLSDTQRLFQCPPIHRSPRRTSFPAHNFYKANFCFSLKMIFPSPGPDGSHIPIDSRSPEDHTGHIPFPHPSPAIGRLTNRSAIYR